MTAEIAILNKSAVALATDSAVTISAGSKEEKIYDSADKLFELSLHNPIGIMIYNGMSFLETPLPILIKKFRCTCDKVDKVSTAAKNFLSYLSEFVQSSPQSVIDHSTSGLYEPLVGGIANQFSEKFANKYLSGTEKLRANPKDVISSLLDETISEFEQLVHSSALLSFVDSETPKLGIDLIKKIEQTIKNRLPSATNAQRRQIVSIVKIALLRKIPSDSITGIIFSGYGSNELFPTLVSYEIDGVVEGKIRYYETNNIDIDRTGTRASVLPFAQKEMVERFLYGLDGGMEQSLTKFCKERVSDISKEIFEQLQFVNKEDSVNLRKEIVAADNAFVSKLKERVFDHIRSQSRKEIEDMVEFMPKPEMAKMAEALVNLTSIKRRVSRGMETVGGPIDVAVISLSEGFIWAQRKHYFPADLNVRYSERVRKQAASPRESHDEQDQEP